MPRFIPSAKLNQLRDASRGGDERAKAILRAQIDPNSDFDAMFEEYFKPAPMSTVEVVNDEPEKIDINDGDKLLKKFLDDNDIRDGDEDYDEAIEMFYQAFPKHDHRHDHEYEHEHEHEHECECGENCEDAAKKLEEPENIGEPGCECMTLAEQLKKLTADENEAVAGYDSAIMIITNDPEMSNDEKTVMITTLQSIKEDELEHISILMDKLKKYEKKENKVEEVDEVPESVI